MKKISLVKLATCCALAAAGMVATSCQGNKTIPMKAPEAKKVEHLLVNHGDTLVDNYYWLKEKTNPEVIQHLEAENAYCNAVMAHTEKLQADLFTELKSRIKEEDESVPTRQGSNYYYSKTVKGKQYREYYRKIGSLEAEPQLILDCNALAEGKKYFSLAVFSVSPNQRYLAYATDTDGSEYYTLYFKDLETGELLKDEIKGVSPSGSWAMDSQTIFYTIRDEAWRPYKVLRHTLGQPQASDKEVYHEKDERFTVGVGRSKNDKYLMLFCSSQVTSEIHLMPANKPDGEFKVFAPRRQNVEYSVTPHENKFYIRTNADGAVNFKLMEAPENATDAKNWKEVVAHNPSIKLEYVDGFKDYLVLGLLENGLDKLKVIQLATGKEEYISFPDPCYTLYSSSNPNYDEVNMRYSYSSMTRPTTVYEYNMADKSQKILKTLELGVPYNPDDYQSERIFATASDGTSIPISIVYKKGFKKDGNAPLLLYGYGSYGSSMDAGFGSNRISLLNRGFAWAIAHVRGGAEMGEQWYLDGKLMKKKNTFTDFIACAEMLVKEKYTSPKHLGAMGGSAGGLLMGAITNMRPDLFNAIIADVPFVDVMNTMCDATLPLTVGEYEEWGNPTEDKEAYEYMKSYSPYDNITPQAYPYILATAGLNDPRVSYWEPAKWVLKLRDNNTGDKPIILQTNMGAGHGGASGRYDYLKEIALDYAFLIDRLK